MTVLCGSIQKLKLMLGKHFVDNFLVDFPTSLHLCVDVKQCTLVDAECFHFLLNLILTNLSFSLLILQSIYIGYPHLSVSNYPHRTQLFSF